MPGPYIKLRCSSPVCPRVCVMPQDAYDQASGDAIHCVDPHCAGTMYRFGNVLTKRRTIESNQDYSKAFERNRDGRKRKKSSLLASGDWDVEDDDPEIAEPSSKKFKTKETEDYDDEDPEWVLPAEFNPAMRLTTEKHEKVHQCNPAWAGWIHSKCAGINAITNPIPGERQKKTSTAMGGRSAWRYALDSGAQNARKFKPGTKNYYEWCHLHGDRLGGECKSDNLVAAHYAVNTWMLAIEEVLSGKSQYATEVTAYCTMQDIAEYIHYRVLRRVNGTVAFEMFIDGRITRFNQADYDRVKTYVRKKLG